MIQEAENFSRTKAGLVIDAETQTVVDAPRHIDLATPIDVRREMAKVYRDMRSGKIDPQDGTRLAYVLGLLIKAIDADETQERIKALQRAIENRR